MTVIIFMCRDNVTVVGNRMHRCAVFSMSSMYYKGQSGCRSTGWSNSRDIYNPPALAVDAAWGGRNPPYSPHSSHHTKIR